MNYELAKKLKEAGFPQPINDLFRDGQEYYNDEGRLTYACEDHGVVTDCVAIVPTLSELIEACGDKFYRLQKDFREDGCIWIASYWKGQTPAILGYGSTPEEAVANLWLELNKKD